MSSSSLAKFLKTLKRADLLITPRLDAWLVAHPEWPTPEPADLALFARLLQQRGSRTGTFTGSQAGDCERRQMFNYIGVPRLLKVDPVLQNIFFDGTWRHVRWMMMLTYAIPGMKVETRVDAPSINFRGSLDGVHHRERWGFELKGTRMFTKVVQTGVFDSHLLQATRYWLATDEDPTYPEEINKWSYIYENKFSNEHREIVVARDLQAERWVTNELKRLNQGVRDHELPPVINECARGTGPTFKGCPFAHICLKTHTWEEAEQLTSHPVDAPTTRGSVPRTRPKKARPDVGRPVHKKPPRP